MTPYEAMLAAEALKGKGAPLMSPANPYATNPFQPGTVVPQGYGVSQDFSGQDRDIENQRLQALVLQKQSQESPGIIQAGNVAVAGASPLTALAQGLMGWQSGKMNRKADEASSTLSKTMAEQAARKAKLEAEEAAAKAAKDEKKAILDQQKADDANERARLTRENALLIAQQNQSAQDARNNADNDAAMKRAQLKASTEEQKAEDKKKDKEDKGYEFPTQKERDKFATGGAKLSATEQLLTDFKDEYAAPALLRATGTGFVENIAQGSLGIGTEGQSGYWSNVAKAELLPRHEMFGSAFTAAEQKAYDATTITPNLRAAEIRSRLGRRVALERQATERQAAGALLKGVRPKDVKLSYGDVIDIDDLQRRLSDGSFEAEQDARREAAKAEAGNGGATGTWDEKTIAAKKARLAWLKAKQAAGAQ